VTRLDREAHMTIKSLTERGVCESKVVRLLGVTERAVPPARAGMVRFGPSRAIGPKTAIRNRGWSGRLKERGDR
jgi:hypothetical protein